MRRINKKGLSGVIAILLFVVLIMASLSMLYNSLTPLLKSPGTQLAPLASCLDLQSSRSLEITSAIYENNLLKIDVEKSYLSLSSFDFILKSEGNEKRYSCGPICGGSCTVQESGSKTFVFSDANVEEIRIIANENCEIDSFQI